MAKVIEAIATTASVVVTAYAGQVTTAGAVGADTASTVEGTSGSFAPHGDIPKSLKSLLCKAFVDFKNDYDRGK